MTGESEPQSWIYVAIDDLDATLGSKNDDYRIDGEFSNFEFAADIAGIEVVDSIANQLAIKLGRIKGLRGKPSINNEALLDSYKDLAGYAVILYAYALSKQGADESDCAHVSYNEHKMYDLSDNESAYLRKCNDCNYQWMAKK